MPVTDSRQGPGTLTLGDTTPLDVTCQASNVRLVPEAEEEDGTATLCDPKPAPQLTTSWSLQGTAIQDWELAATTGFVEYARTHDGETVAFEWVPNTDVGVTYAGSCQIRAVEIGGDVGVQNTTDWEFPVVGALTRTEGATGAREVVAA